MEPSDSIGAMYRRIAEQLKPAPTYVVKADTAPAVDDDQGIDGLVIVSVDGKWIPELELIEQGFEIVRATSDREIERCIDSVVRPKRITRST